MSGAVPAVASRASTVPAPAARPAAPKRQGRPASGGGDQRLEGEQGRALASGPWLYCAFCKTQVPPVYVSGPKQGQPTDRCPTCSGPLSESKVEAASEVVRASEAATYRAARTQARGG